MLECLRKVHPAVSRLAEGTHCPANTLAHWHKVLKLPQWRHLTPQWPGSPLPFTGVTPWRGDTLPSLPIPWLGSNPSRGSHGSATAGLYYARWSQLHRGRSFSGLKGWSVDGPAAEPPCLHFNAFRPEWLQSAEKRDLVFHRDPWRTRKQKRNVSAAGISTT